MDHESKGFVYDSLMITFNALLVRLYLRNLHNLFLESPIFLCNPFMDVQL